MSGTPAKAIALLTALQLSAGSLLAQDNQIRSLFPARPTGYVTDVARVLDPAVEARITDLIERLKAATGAEVAVVTLPTIGQRDGADVAREIGRTWKVGQAGDIGDPTRNAGVVLLVVLRQEGRPGSGQVRVEVGQGLEGIITDVTAGRVRDLMTERLSQDDYNGALQAAVEELAGLIAEGFGVSDTALTNARPSRPHGTRSPLIGALPILLFIAFVLFSNFMSGRGRRGRRRRRTVYWGGPWIGGGFGGGGWGGGGGGFGGGFGGFGGGGGFSGGGAGGRF